MTMGLHVAGRDIATDKEGYLRHLEDWSPSVAEAIAAAEGILLSDAHWEVLEQLRAFYQEYQLSPAMRPLTRYLSQHLGADKARSIYLLQLFPGSPAKVASKIAGLPRPTNCL